MSRPRSSLTPPPRPPETPIEVLYNTAVQSFVRRDHLKTQAALTRLLALLPPQTRHWADFSPPRPSTSEENHDGLGGKPNGHVDGELLGGGEEWTLKALKLFITWHVSLYTDPPSSTSGLSSEVVGLLSPTPPDRLLRYLESVCRNTIATSSTSSQDHIDREGGAGEESEEEEEEEESSILPPALISTLLLAALKLKPSSSSLTYAHHLAESWLARLPSSLFTADGRTMSPSQKRKLESAREGYLRVLELFVGEVLAREGEWEMARGILDGESMMGSKRKEGLYKHLRAVQSRPPAPSPASSVVLDPSTSLSLSGLLPPTPPSLSGSGGGGASRPRSSSASSSSSERTARPSKPNGTIRNGVRPLSVSATSTERLSRDKKGKGRAVDSTAAAETDDESSVPSKIYIHHRTPSSTDSTSQPWTVESSARRAREVLWGILPPSLSHRLATLSPLQLLGWSLPVPLLGLILLILGLRRRIRRRTPGTGVDPTRNLRERLRTAGGRAGFRVWLLWFLRWWMDKVAGVWRMGTTITYL